MSVEIYRESPGKFDSRTLNRKTLSRWTGRKTADGRGCGSAWTASSEALDMILLVGKQIIVTTLILLFDVIMLSLI